jgi:SAM-dependent methyltransferase
MNQAAGSAPQYFGRDLEAMSFARNYHAWIRDEFAPYLTGDVAEVGAGTGNFSQMLLQTSNLKRLLAIEPSANMFPHLRDALAQDTRADAENQTLDAIYAQHCEQFDAITYVNVLEHIERDAQQLQFARDTLKPGGHLLIFVPALPWLFSNLDRQVGHFRRYTRKPLRNLVVGAGFEIVKLHYFDVAGILPWYVAFVLMKRPIGGGSVSAYDRFVVPPMRKIESLIRPPIGKNLLLVAKKI